jgi:hypothetical protein
MEASLQGNSGKSIVITTNIKKIKRIDRAKGAKSI